MKVKSLKPKTENPFVSRLIASGVIFLIVLGVFGGFWLMAALVPDGRSDMEGAKLPQRSSLLSVEGKVIQIQSRSGSRPRSGTFYRPIVEYNVNGTSYQVGTLHVYSDDFSFPRQGQTAEIFYTPGQPETAWLKWEYDRFIEKYNQPRFTDWFKAIINFISLGVISLTAVLLLINILVGLKESIKKE